VKIRAAIKIIDGIHTNRRARVATWRKAILRYNRYRGEANDWVERMFQRLFMGTVTTRPLREFRDELAERAAMRSEPTKGDE
jgi:hypothetical protein